MKSNFSRQPKLLATTATGSQGSGVVIVGGGSGAYHAVESLREVSVLLSSVGHLLMSIQHGFNGSITVLTKEPHAPIDR